MALEKTIRKRVWLSGSRGFVGTYLKEQLLEANFDVLCLSQRAGKDIIKVDFLCEKSVTAALSKYGAPDTFIHLGWDNVYQPHHESHVKYNLNAGKNIIDQMYSSGVTRIIHVGSSSEYGNRVGALKEKYFEPIGEVNNYVRGKLALAKYGLEKAKEFNKVFIHCRLYYTYGAGQQHNSLINQLYFNAVKGNSMNLSPCTQFRDYIFVQDAARGIIEICNVSKSGVINLGSGQVIQLKEFVEIFWESLGGDCKSLKFGSHDQPLHEQSQPKSYADLTILKSLTGWEPITSIREGIRLSVERLYKI